MNREYNSNNEELYPVVSMVDWILMTILGSFPFVAFVMYIIFSISDNINPSKKSYAQLMLIMQVIHIVIGFIFVLFLISSGILDEIMREANV